MNTPLWSPYGFSVEPMPPESPDGSPHALPWYQDREDAFAPDAARRWVLLDPEQVYPLDPEDAGLFCGEKVAVPDVCVWHDLRTSGGSETREHATEFGWRREYEDLGGETAF